MVTKLNQQVQTSHLIRIRAKGHRRKLAYSSDPNAWSILL